MKLLRTAGVAAVLLVVALFGAGPAAGAPSDDPTTSGPTGYACLDEDNGYAPPGACQLLVRAQAVCRGDVPWLDYTLTPEGTPNTTATLTWINPNGADIVTTNLPLSGSVMWPGAEVDANGNAVDWPGWNLVNGVWVEGDAFDWVRPDVQVLFQVNPETQIAVHYPEATAPCAGPEISVVKADEDASVVLAATGSDIKPLLLAGSGLLLVGAVLLAARAASRRRTAQH